MPFCSEAAGGPVRRFSVSRYKHSRTGIFAAPGASWGRRNIPTGIFPAGRSLFRRLEGWKILGVSHFCDFVTLFSQVPFFRNLEILHIALIVVKVVIVDRVDRVV